MKQLADERDILANNLLDKRERVNKTASQQREERDRLNEGTRAHAGRRDELNAQVRALVDEANKHRNHRDALNAQVREGKRQRDELNALAHEKSQQLQALRRDQGATGTIPLAKLKAELRRLEYEHQTKALTPKKEKELIELLSAKQKEINEREAEYKEGGDVQKAYEEMKEAKAAAEEQHKHVTTIAQQAQAEHEAMVNLFNQADALRKQADAAQAAFVASKTEADKHHRQFIEAIQQTRDLDRVAHALRPTPATAPHAPTGAAATRQDQRAADDIFDRFRRGEKLSTEDLMALQKAGRL